MTELTTRMLLPVAHEEDAKRTCRALLNHRLGEPDSSKIIVVHVIEKAGGAPDKAPLPAREEQAERIFGSLSRYSGVVVTRSRRNSCMRRMSLTVFLMLHAMLRLPRSCFFHEKGDV